MADNADAHSKADLIASEVLVKEFEAIHGHLPPDLRVPPGRAVEQLAWLRRTLDPDAAPPGQGRLQTALCLSGGGIRSATYSLGVLQGLAQLDQLDRFHYLSTVSGGGYVGSWLNGWIRRAGLDTVTQALKESAVGASPAPPARAAATGRRPEPPELQRLRAYSNFLSPAAGLSDDMMALAAIFLRNLLLHWLVLVPVLALLLLLPRLVLALMGAQQVPAVPAALAALGLPPLELQAVLWPLAVALVVAAVAYMAADLPGRMPKRGQEPVDHFKLLCLLPLALASALFAWLGPWLTSDTTMQAVARWLQGWLPWTAGWHPATATCVVYAAAGTLAHWLGAALGIAARGWRGLPQRIVPKRWLDLTIAGVIGAAGAALLFFTLTLLAPWWGDSTTLPTDTAQLTLREAYAVLAAPSMLGVFWLGMTLFAGFGRRFKSEDDREWWARAAGRWLLTALGWVALTVAVLWLPLWLLWLAARVGASGSTTVTGGAAVLGVLTSAWGFWSRNREQITRQVKSLVDRLAARMLELLALAFIVVLAAALGLGLSAALGAAQDWPDTDPAAADCAATAPAGGAPGAHYLGCVRQQHAGAWAAAQAAQRCKPVTAAAATRLPEGCSATTPTLPAAEQAAATFRAVLHGSSGLSLAVSTLALGLAVLVLPWAIGVNTFSLHGMYGNRLIRAYLGASARNRQPHWFTGFDPDDNLPLAETGLRERRLFPVINTALNLVQISGDRLEWQQRKAASFIFTPQHCGSAALGYAPTQTYGHKLPTAPWQGGVSIGRAMAISGAAASPNMGYHSSLPVAFAMSFFNVRLGWWMPNPLDKYQGRWVHDEPSSVLHNVIDEALARTSEQTPFVYLSDGGHFENLGLYEMVRRRCRRILVVDATQDPGGTHEDLQQSIRKIRIDFGISVTFARGLPTAESCQRTAQPFALGTIHYGEADAGASDGELLYLKPALWPGLPADLIGYAAGNNKRGPRFPHQSTADQFFDEAQFESYRLLGLLSVRAAFGAKGAWPRPQDAPDHRPPPGAPAAATAPR